MLRISTDRYAVAIAVAIQLAAGVTPAAAQKKVSIYALGGYYIASDLYVGTNVNNKLKVDDSFTYGGRLVYLPQTRVGIELSYARAKSNIKNTNPGVSFASGSSVTLDQIDVSGIYSGYEGAGHGYVSLGLGTTAFTPHFGANNGSAQWRFAWNVGVGFMVDVGQSMTARLDGRYRGTNTNRTTGSGGYCDAFGNCYGYASMVYWSGEITAGLGFRF